MKSIAESLVLIASTKLGVRESGGPNKGAALAPFFEADWYDPNGSAKGDDGYPWCAAFICWCVMVAVAGRMITFKRPRTPSARGLIDWSLAQDDSTNTKMYPGKDIRRGDIVVFDSFSHCGIATSPPNANGLFHTIEGNTNAAGSREGDGVHPKVRPMSDVRARIRFK